MNIIPFSQVEVGQTISLVKDAFALYVRLPDTKNGNSRFQPLNHRGEQTGHWTRFCSRWNCRLLESNDEITAAIHAKASQYDA